MKKLTVLLIALTWLGCRPVPPPVLPGPLPETLSAADTRWVEETLAELTLREKAAQLVMVRAYGRYHHPSSPTHRALIEAVDELAVGGIVLFDSDLETVPRLLDELQAASSLPLLVASDLERGAAFRVRRGSVSLPYAMAIGATRSEEAARFLGEVTAREGRALGIHWALAPVVDVNNNPANPVINIRSFGEDPEWVGRLGAAFVEGARSGGMLTALKHFPGHGDTAIDSHVALPVITADREQLGRVELAPFRAAIAAGADAVMTGHIAVPALDPSGTPATLSPRLTHQLLRDEMGFEGLIVTDAIEMNALGGEAGFSTWTGGATVQAVQAGADVVLLPADPKVAIDSLVRAVEEGQLTEERIDRSARRLLATKARLGLHQDRYVDPEEPRRSLARPTDQTRARQIAADSITLVQNRDSVLPLQAEEPLRLLHLTLSADFESHPWPTASLRARKVPYTHRRLGAEVSPESEQELVEAAGGYTHVLISAFVRNARGEPRRYLSPSQTRLVEQLITTGTPVILTSFGSPYLLAEVPEVSAYLCAYGAAEVSQRAAMAALFGETDLTGRLPVTIPEHFAQGHGIELARRPMTLEAASPAEAGFSAERLARVDWLIENWMDQGAFPGAVVAVGHQGKLAKLTAYGKISRELDSPATTPETIYDLASLTKVIATTTMAMMLVDAGRLDLDARVESFLPGFVGEGKSQVRVRHLLTHSSGVDWWAPLYETKKGRTEYLEAIQAAPLAYPPGSQTKYSDLGVILLGEILERVAGEPIDNYLCKRLFRPLGMEDTLFSPLDSYRDLAGRIAPTEEDAWRGRLIRGEVHDENAFALGGVAPHAGLFGTAGDLARFAQMMINGGVFEHRRYLSRATVESFTRRAGMVEGSDRALGWDTKSPERSSAGTLFSSDSFGHTGFTGTSIWIDPRRELFVILLTNRVHPTRQNTLIRTVRPQLADAVVDALIDASLPSDEPTSVAQPADGPPADEPLVLVGLERLGSELGAPLAGKKVGLVVHAASVTWDGRHAIDVAKAAGLEVVRLFTPEHGLRGRAAAGERVQSGRDPVSGLPVVSLYGAQRKPDPEDLADLDALVFDLQGAGVRFYTYVSTMILCIEAAAEAGIEFVVLDRPNPLGGERVEGPVAAPRERVPASFVNMAPGPLVHGLTMGEMARVVNATLDNPANVTVIPMLGWNRSMTWADTARRWVPPSPNLRTAEAALVYPGTALLEATNVSEGRGTEAPFLRLGAPWLDVVWLLADLPAEATAGLTLTPITFVPRASEAARSPKYLGEECRGLAIAVTDPKAMSPYTFAAALIQALEGQKGFEWRRNGEALTWLLGTDAANRLSSKSSEATARWRTERERALLYP